MNNVNSLVEELTYRKKVDYVFTHVFAEQFAKEQRNESLVSRPRDFKCMRAVHATLDEECDGITSNEYAMHFNKYVVDFCETTPKDQQSLLDGVIHQVCGISTDMDW